MTDRLQSSAESEISGMCQKLVGKKRTKNTHGPVLRVDETLRELLLVTLLGSSIAILLVVLLIVHLKIMEPDKLFFKLPIT